MYPLFIYFGIILLSALHGYMPLPGWKPLRGQLLLIHRMLPDPTLRNNGSSLQKLEIIKSLLALGAKEISAQHQEWASVSHRALQQVSRITPKAHERYTLPPIRKTMEPTISRHLWRFYLCVCAYIPTTYKKQISNKQMKIQLLPFSFFKGQKVL